MRFLWLSALVVALDQATKAAVLQFMAAPGGVPRSIPVLGDWLRLTFTENPGMAFGLTIGPPGTVTVLSILATVLVAGYIYQVRRGYAPYVWSLSLILGGALGNIIDRVFYGVLLDYGPYFTGHVVDFIHVSLWRGFVPDIVPLIGGAYMELFPIWNVADMAIVLGVVGVLAFHRAFHRRRLAAQGEAAPGDDAPGADAPADADAPDAAPDSDWPATDGVSARSDAGDEADGAGGAPSEEWQPDDWPDRARD
jgi:signal peptidase II